MRTPKYKTKTLVTSVATLALCCSVTASADLPDGNVRDRNVTEYTKAVVAEGEATDASTRSPEAALARHNGGGLRLLQYAWDSTALFGRLLSRDTASEAERTVTRWLHGLGPSGRWQQQPPWTAYALSTPATHGKSYADRFLPGSYGTDWQGRMPSLAATMASPYDTTMALDDIERGPDEGLRIGLRIVWPLTPKQGNSPVAFKFVGFGF